MSSGRKSEEGVSILNANDTDDEDIIENLKTTEIVYIQAYSAFNHAVSPRRYRPHITGEAINAILSGPN